MKGNTILSFSINASFFPSFLYFFFTNASLWVTFFLLYFPCQSDDEDDEEFDFSLDGWIDQKVDGFFLQDGWQVVAEVSPVAAFILQLLFDLLVCGFEKVGVESTTEEKKEETGMLLILKLIFMRFRVPQRGVELLMRLLALVGVTSASSLHRLDKQVQTNVDDFELLVKCPRCNALRHRRLCPMTCDKRLCGSVCDAPLLLESPMKSKFLSLMML